MRKGVLLGLLLALLLSGTVLAASYSANITVTESSGSNYTLLPVLVLMDNSDLVDAGFVSSTGLDTRVFEGGVALPHVLVDDRTLFVANIDANTQHLFEYTTGNTALSSFPVIVGHDGYATITDHTSLELGSTFDMEVKGLIDTTAGADKDIWLKTSACRWYVSAAGSIKFEITGGTSVTATGVSSGVHTIQVVADGTNLKIFVDTIEKDSSVLGGVGVPDNANNITILQNDVMPYMEYLKVTVG